MGLIGLLVGGMGVLFNMLSSNQTYASMGWVFGLAGALISLLALKQINNGLPPYDPQKALLPQWASSKGLAIAGLICGAVAFTVGLVLYITCVACKGCASLCGASALERALMDFY